MKTAKTKLKFSSITEKEVKKIKREPRLFAELLRDNENFINKIIHKINKNKDEDYEYFLDSFQDGSIGLWNAVTTYKGTKSKFSTYAYTCIYNAVLQKVQKNDKKKADDISIEKFIQNTDDGGSEYYENRFIFDYSDPYSQIDKQIDEEIMLSKMNENDTIIYNSRIQGLSLKDTAEKVGMKFSTFKVYYYKVFLKKMKDLLK